MAQMAIRLAHTRAAHPSFADVTCIGIRVERDGGRHGYFTVMASGPQLHLDHADIASRPDFWDAAAIVGAMQIRELLPMFTPLPDRTKAVDVPLDFGLVDEVLRAGEVPTIAEDTVLDEWTE